MKKNAILINFIAPLLAVICSFMVGAGFILILGHNPIRIYGILFSGILGSSYGMGQLLFYATPLIFTGLAVAFAFQAGLFNIGAEGQLYMGALFCAWLGWYLKELPAFILLPVCFAGAFCGGALWGLIPGILKAKTGAHEVITTIMLNFIALAFTNYIVSAYFFVPGTVRTPEIGIGAQIPRLDIIFSNFRGSPVNLSLIIALLVSLAVWYILWQSRLGYELRATGKNQEASEYSGIDISRNIVITMVISGGLAGLVGTNFVMGYKHYFEQGFSGGVGFMGIAVALLGKNHPVGIVIAGLLFGGLSFGGLLINSMVPKEIVEILQATVILFVVIGNTVFSRILLRKDKKRNKAISCKL